MSSRGRVPRDDAHSNDNGKYSPRGGNDDRRNSVHSSRKHSVDRNHEPL